MIKDIKKEISDIIDCQSKSNISLIEQILNKTDESKYNGYWYCQVVNKVIHKVDCYEVMSAGYKVLKKEALFIRVELDEWEHICESCINNPDNN